MLPTLSPLTPPQRAGYVVSLVCISSGWLLLLVCIFELTGGQWSRAALGLQGAALLVALSLAPRVPTHRLVVYPLVLAVSTYLWDTTLPPPNFPSGWPRTVVPGGVLIGLMFDYARVLHHARQRRAAEQPGAQVTRDLPITIRGQSSVGGRRPLPQQRSARSAASARRDAGADAIPAASHRRKPRWWQLYGWIFVMSGLLLGFIPRVIPPAWEMVAQGIWCVLTFAGMKAWVWANRTALLLDDQAQEQTIRRYSEAPLVDPERTIPLTSVQRHFLDVVDRHDRH